jgi:hypothetical protein
MCGALSYPRGSPLVSLELALPCQLLSGGEESRRTGTHVDPREAPVSARPHPFATAEMAHLTPGIEAVAGSARRLAECVMLRGPRSAAGALDLATAHEALAAALAEEEEGRRGPRQLSLASCPLPLGPAFPRVFAGTGARGRAVDLGDHGEAVAAGAMTRLARTTAFGPVLRDVARAFRGAGASPQGRALLEGWGHVEDRAECVERLLQMAGDCEDEE